MTPASRADLHFSQEEHCQQKTMRQQSVSNPADSFKASDGGPFGELSTLSVKSYIDILIFP